MAQRLFEDKIPTLTESAGTITLPSGARLTIGGRQHVTTSALNVAADLSAANTRYQVFAVESAGVPILVVSSNENSQGPAGYSAWKLVGSYYTGTLSQFLQFADVAKAEYSDIQETLDQTNPNAGNFTSGDFLISRRGSIVTISNGSAVPTHASLSAPTSGANFLPPWAIPVQSTSNCSQASSSQLYHVAVGATGTLQFIYRNYSAAQTVRTNTSTFSASYSIDASPTTPIEDL